MEDAIRIFAPRADEKGLELACHILPDVPDALVGDSGRLRQIILNLVGNAIKFTAAGEVIVEVAVDTRDRRRGRACGSPSPTRASASRRNSSEQIFGAFVQADASTTRRFGGTGLGLTISSQLVEMMGGRIMVKSELGRGSQFHFTARFGVQPPSDAPRRPSAANLHDLRVLVVDDNATNRTILQELLVNWRMQPTGVASAATALAAMTEAAKQDRPFHLVLSDALMPDVDGFTLARQIADDDRLADAKVIMLTSGSPADSPAHAGPKPRDTRANSAIVSQLTKPVKQSDLLDAILTAFGEPHAARRPARPARAAAAAQDRPPSEHPGRGRQPHQSETRGAAARAIRSSRHDRGDRA